MDEIYKDRLNLFKSNFDTEDYKKTLNLNHYNLITYLLDNEIEFNLSLNKSNIIATPEIDKDIYDNLEDMLFFTLQNYSYTTVTIDNNFVNFDIAFKGQNFATNIKIKLEDIFQIRTISDEILSINILATFEKKKSEKDYSKTAFMKNKSNDRFFN